MNIRAQRKIKALSALSGFVALSSSFPANPLSPFINIESQASSHSLG